MGLNSLMVVYMDPLKKRALCNRHLVQLCRRMAHDGDKSCHVSCSLKLLKGDYLGDYTGTTIWDI